MRIVVGGIDTVGFVAFRYGVASPLEDNGRCTSRNLAGTRGCLENTGLNT